MNTRTLSVFVDESGVLHQSDVSSRFYLLTLVFHNQSNAIDTLADEFDASIRRLGIERMCFHAGPIIRQTDDFAILSWEFRAKIFSLMMGFVRKADFSYHTFIVDKKFAHQLAMSPSEHKFFGGPRNFKKNILRRIKAKEF